MCEGCAGAVRRILQKIEGERQPHCTTSSSSVTWNAKLPGIPLQGGHLTTCYVFVCMSSLSGVENIDITVAENKVVVTGSNLDPKLLVEKVAKSGKATELWPTKA